MGVALSTISVACNSLTCCFSCTNFISNFNGACNGSSKVVNGVYVLILGLVATMSYLVRGLGDRFNIHLHAWEVHCSDHIDYSGNYENNNEYCQADAGVYRLSFVLTSFFGFMSVFTFLSPSFHYSKWGFKFLGIAIVSIIAFFMPNTYFDESGFAWIARVGSILFILLQMLLLIDFAYEWGDYMVQKAFPDDDADHNKVFIFAMLGISLALYLSVFIGMPLAFTYYPNHLVMCAFTLFQVILLSGLTLARHKISGNDELRGQMLPAAFISAYIMYLLWSALDSDVAEFTNEYDLKLIIGSIFAIISLMYTAFSTSNSLEDIMADSATDLGEPLVSGNTRKNNMLDEEESIGDARNRIVLFHCLMMFASMYMAMLVTNWGVNEFNADKVLSVRHGNIWVKLISQWVIVLLYIWSLFAPAILTDRDFN